MSVLGEPVRDESLLTRRRVETSRRGGDPTTIEQGESRPSRFATVRLLIAGALDGLVSPRLTRAMQADRDGDGLYDDDETAIYGTPDVFDTDGDVPGDGVEVYLGTDSLDRGRPCRAN
jgi:hypothetical protein